MVASRSDQPQRNAAERQRRLVNPAYRARRNAAVAKWRQDPQNQLKLRDWYYRRKYGLSLADIEDMVAAQDGGCAICETKDPGTRNKGGYRRWHVDHDHSTGAVRGVLCSNCNVGLGSFQDNAEFLLNAAIYIEDTNGG